MFILALPDSPCHLSLHGKDDTSLMLYVMQADLDLVDPLIMGRTLWLPMWLPMPT